MESEKLVSYLEKLEQTSKTLELTEITSELFKEAKEDLPIVALFVQGKTFPAHSPKELGIAEKTMVKCLSTVSGFTEDKIKDEIAEKGDTGKAAAFMLDKKVQTTLGREEVDVKGVKKAISKIASLEGRGSEDVKEKKVAELINSVSPKEAKYLVRLLLNEMRVGVGEGIVRDALAKAFDKEKNEVEKAFSLLNDYGEVAKLAEENRLDEVSMKLFRPLRPMLAQTVESPKEAVEDNCSAWEYKYDGLRTQIHVSGDEVKVFTRRLDDVTEQFPDVVRAVKENVSAEEAIIEGETVAVDENGRPRRFQLLSRRIKRKYDIDETVKKIPVVTYLFDCMYLNGKNLIKKPFQQRRKKLKSIVTEEKELKLSKMVVTENENEINQFYEKALELGHEGVMAKNLEAEYKPGSRVGYMYKLKPEAETLELVIVGAEWGEGKRTKWLS